MTNKLISLLSAIWIGAILAISMEAKVKFNASLVDLRIGLDVGRTVFTAFDIAQWCVMAALALLVVSTKNRKLNIALFLLLVIFVYQSYLILPILITMAEIYINSGFVEKSYIHIIYIVAEIVKITLLAYLANQAFESRPHEKC